MDIEHAEEGLRGSRRPLNAGLRTLRERQARPVSASREAPTQALHAAARIPVLREDRGSSHQDLQRALIEALRKLLP